MSRHSELVDWWKNLPINDKARITVPFVQMVGRKPLKADWHYVTQQELADLFELAEYLRANKPQE